MLLLALLGVGGCGEELVVEEPVFRARSIDAMEIERIIANEEETVFRIDASACGGELSSLNKMVYMEVDGEAYPLQEARGIELAKGGLSSTTVDMANPHFDLVFTSLPAGTQSVNLILKPGGKSAPIAIWGIRLDGRRYKGAGVSSKLADWQPDNSRDWRGPEVGSGQNWLEIHLLGYLPEMDMVRVARLGMLPWSEEYLVDERGIVVAEFNQYASATVRVTVGSRHFDVVMDPGEKGVLYIDIEAANLRHSPYFAANCGRAAYYQGGRWDDLNNRLVNREAEMFTGVWALEKGTAVDSARYLEICQEAYQKRLRELADDSSLSGEYRRYLELEARLVYASRVLAIRTNLMELYGCDRRDERLPNVTAELFFSLSKVDFRTNDLLLMNTDMLKKIFRYFGTAEELEGCFGEGYLSDLYRAKACENRLMRKLPLEEEQLAAMRQATPETVRLFELVYAGEREAWKRHLAKPGYRACEVPEVADEALFDALLKPYRGRVVLVDFWGTACIPCVRAMKLMKPLKEELAGEPISYVYITGETAAPLETWQQMIPDIGGDHYRLSRKQSKYLNKQFHISAIPYYVLVDQAGEVVFQSTGFMGNDKLRALFKQELTK